MASSGYISELVSILTLDWYAKDTINRNETFTHIPHGFYSFVFLLFEPSTMFDISCYIIVLTKYFQSIVSYVC
jgi:hypothetical protein